MADRAELFQNLNGEADNVELKFANNAPYLMNLLYETTPLVIHGNGPSKVGLIVAVLGFCSIVRVLKKIPSFVMKRGNCRMF